MSTQPFSRHERRILSEREVERSQTSARSDDHERRTYLRDWKRERREQALKKVVPDRMCPVCGELKPSSRSWVVGKRMALHGLKTETAGRLREKARAGQVACCRGCAQKHFTGRLFGRGSKDAS